LIFFLLTHNTKQIKRAIVSGVVGRKLLWVYRLALNEYFGNLNLIQQFLTVFMKETMLCYKDEQKLFITPVRIRTLIIKTKSFLGNFSATLAVLW
jgi:hypothetical protein